MPYHKLPDHVIPRRDHKAQKFLNLLDANLLLCWNGRINRYEVWRSELQPRGIFYGFIRRLIAKDHDYLEPGEWLLTEFRRRDPRYVPLKDAVAEQLKDIKEQEAQERVADENRNANLRDEIAREYIPLWRKKADPDEFAKEYHDWDKAPIYSVPMTDKRAPRERTG